MSFERTPELDVEAATARLGSVIRRERSGRFTVQELAKTAGISVGLLSEIERGKGNPSFKTLQKLARALNLRIGDLVEAAADRDPNTLVVRRGERTRLQFGSEGLVYELLTPNLRGRLEMLQTSIPAGFSNQAHPFRHEGEECVLVLEGELEVSVDEVTYTLCDGDAVTYDPSHPHWWRNRTDREAVVVGAVTPPSF